MARLRATEKTLPSTMPITTVRGCMEKETLCLPGGDPKSSLVTGHTGRRVRPHDLPDRSTLLHPQSRD